MTCFLIFAFYCCVAHVGNSLFHSSDDARTIRLISGDVNGYGYDVCKIWTWTWTVSAICVSDCCTDCDFVWSKIAACYFGRSLKIWCGFPVLMKSYDSDVFDIADGNDLDFYRRRFDDYGYEQPIHNYFVIPFFPS